MCQSHANFSSKYLHKGIQECLLLLHALPILFNAHTSVQGSSVWALQGAAFRHRPTPLANPPSLPVLSWLSPDIPPSRQFVCRGYVAETCRCNKRLGSRFAVVPCGRQRRHQLPPHQQFFLSLLASVLLASSMGLSHPPSKPFLNKLSG